MAYVLQRHEDGAFVAPRGSPASYTQDLRKARKYTTKEEAEKDRCVGNESVLTVEQAAGVYR
jgi:hypothetical protein